MKIRVEKGINNIQMRLKKKFVIINKNKCLE